MDESFELSAVEESFVEEEVVSAEMYKCDVCCFTSKYKSSLTRHIYNKHIDLRKEKNSKAEDEKTFICDQCGRNFRSRTGLRLHAQSIHERKFKYTCAVCDRGFNRLWNY